MDDPTNLAAGHPRPMTTAAKQVEAVLAADPRFDVRTLKVQVIPHAQAIGLVGWVPGLPEKVWIEADAGDRIGPDRVESCLLVGPPDQRPDADVARVVRDALEADRWIDATSIQVAVSNGVVKLTGLVDTTLLRKLAGALCWWVKGVRGVVNDLDAVYPSPANDELLAEAIRTVLDKDPFVDAIEILVLCHDAVVTLAGTVAGADARDAAKNDAWAVEGVKDVVNQIDIAPEVPGSPRILRSGD
ncbi:MAG: BON domain-containing protein [Chloroflexota bacterium]